MRKRLVWLLAGFAPLLSWAAIQGCGGDSTNPLDGAVDGTTSSDTGAPDGAVNDTGTMMDTGTGDDGSMMDSGGGDSGMGGLAYLCLPDGGTVNDCSQCMGRPRPCVNCAIDGGAHVAYCVTLNTSCFPQGGPLERCPCADAGNCAAPFQVCQDVGAGPACRTCGETQTVNDTCKGGGMCRADGGCN
jgi:hypothetical protein